MSISPPPSSRTASSAERAALDEQVAGSPRKAKSTFVFIRDLLGILALAILLSIGIKEFLVRSFFIPSESMSNTLQINDRILVNELIPAVIPLARGDVVVFTDPGGWLPTTPAKVNPIDAALSVVGLGSSDSNNHLIKRVIGLPGDRVVCCNALGQVTVNGIALREPYLKFPALPSARPFDIVVPAGALWVLGDNRQHSTDSSVHVSDGTPSKGFVPIENVVGRAFVITWPIKHWTVISDYPEVFATVPPPTP